MADDEAAAGGAGAGGAAGGGLTEAAIREMVRGFSNMGLHMNFQALTATVSYSGERPKFKAWMQDLDRIVLSSGVALD